MSELLHYPGSFDRPDAAMSDDGDVLPRDDLSLGSEEEAGYEPSEVRGVDVDTEQVLDDSDEFTESELHRINQLTEIMNWAEAAELVRSSRVN